MTIIAGPDGKCSKCFGHVMDCGCAFKGIMSYEEYLNYQPERLSPEGAKKSVCDSPNSEYK